MRHFDEPARTFVRGRGTMLEDARGRRVYDAVSSIWTTIHGHCHPRIVEAIARQAATLDHATLLGATNPAAEELAERLCAIAGMDRAFFASDGASAVEAAIKMALQYWQIAGQPHRTRFVRLSDAYHGDTIGAMSLSDIALFKSRFGSVTFETQSYDASVPLGDDVAAVIVEPLVQAAAGMRLVPKKVYERLKGLSGGALALSATLVGQSLYDVFLGAPDAFVHFLHGHSYAGNPIACAAALASLSLFEEEGTLERAQGIARRSRARVESLRADPLVRDVRQAGTMLGIELRKSLGRPSADALYDTGHFTRPIGDVIQFVPPLCSSDEEVDAFFDSLSTLLAASA